MPLKNQAMLITYADSLGSNLNDLQKVLQGPLKDVVGGVHILPFFPSSGDRGFAPMDYTKVDPAFGSWADVNALAKDYYLMFDFMVNHISSLILLLYRSSSGVRYSFMISSAPLSESPNFLSVCASCPLFSVARHRE